MSRLALLLPLLLLTPACGKRALGESCADTKECDTGTSCILAGSREIIDGGLSCNEKKRLCSVTCSSDADCASLGSGHICIKDCFQGSCLQGSH